MNKILCCYRNKIAIEKDIALAQRRGCLHEKVQFQGELAQFYLKSGDVDSAIEVYKKNTKDAPISSRYCHRSQYTTGGDLLPYS